MPEKSPNSFFIVRACRGSVGEGAACGGRASSCPAPRHAGELHAASASGAVALMGRSAGKARRPARDMLKPSAASFPLSGFAAHRRAGHQSPPEAGGKVDAAQAFALARAHVVPQVLPGEAMPFASGSAGQRPALPCRQRRSSNRSCGAVRQTQGRERRALLSVRTCAASMLDHEKRGRIGHPPPLSS